MGCTPVPDFHTHNGRHNRKPHPWSRDSPSNSIHLPISRGAYISTLIDHTNIPFSNSLTGAP
ncbi:hypothetical protein FA13DRAFT_1742266 [Coprinellus micaceus]|uniref:Uncharacterized protein n=1 Tax=Coprinellus micaceus TaxID=71717 RepID=A0A4Y7SH81_COPMI|nr:hypothetical protein FA13DRAFT_1742266 [Coprinellus micaceus]